MEVGRPTAMTETVIAKLEEGFLMGFTDREACLYADINPATLYRFCQEHEDFSERKELLKEQTTMRAKRNIAKAINSEDKPDKALSQWWLERKNKAEFAQRTELTGKEGESLKVEVIQYGNDTHSTRIPAQGVPEGTPSESETV